MAMNQPETCTTTLVLADGSGLHLRPAATLAKIAGMYDADIVAQRGRRCVSAKSLFSIIVLCTCGGNRIRVTARGPDAQEAIKAIRAEFPTAAAAGGRARSCHAAGNQKEGGMNTRKSAGKEPCERIATTFTCSLDPGAKTVFVAGDFNNWNPQADAMTKRNGCFVKSFKLVPGVHQYKFIVDGVWLADPSAPAVPNEFGSVNNVVHV